MLEQELGSWLSSNQVALRCLFLCHFCYLISPFIFISDGEIHLDTPFSRLLGKPPIMVAGMTPLTVKAGFVSAVLDAGYHIELAGGGHYNAAALHSKVAEIQKQIPAGVGITLNSLYINPHQFTFQLPLWQEMRKEGLPIEGFCVAASVPTTEKAVEIIDGLKAAGVRHTTRVRTRDEERVGAAGLKTSNRRAAGGSRHVSSPRNVFFFSLNFFFVLIIYLFATSPTPTPTLMPAPTPGTTNLRGSRRVYVLSVVNY